MRCQRSVQERRRTVLYVHLQRRLRAGSRTWHGPQHYSAPVRGTNHQVAAVCGIYIDSSSGNASKDRRCHSSCRACLGCCAGLLARPQLVKVEWIIGGFVHLPPAWERRAPHQRCANLTAGTCPCTVAAAACMRHRHTISGLRPLPGALALGRILLPRWAVKRGDYGLAPPPFSPPASPSRTPPGATRPPAAAREADAREDLDLALFGPIASVDFMNMHTSRTNGLLRCDQRLGLPAAPCALMWRWVGSGRRYDDIIGVFGPIYQVRTVHVPHVVGGWRIASHYPGR